MCRRCGISRPTLRKWVRRYQESGIEGLEDQSRRPKICAPKKIFAQQKTVDFGTKANEKTGSTRGCKMNSSNDTVCHYPQQLFTKC